LGNPRTVGVALTAGAAGGFIDVVTRGYVENAAVATGTALGTPLQMGVGVAGRARVGVAADIAPTIGVCLELAAANTCDVYVFGLGSDS